MEENWSTGSSTNSVLDYIQTINEESEMETSSVESISVEWEDSTGDKTVLCKDTSSTGTRKSFRKMYLVSAAVLLNSINVGYAGVYSSTATADMARKNSPVVVEPNSDAVGWIGSLIAIGSLLGGLVSGSLAEHAGRKGSLLFSTIPLVLGWLLIAYATSLSYIYAGRIIIGASCSIVIVNAPMYLVEISTPEVRGLLGAFFQLFVTLGVLLVSCLGAFLPWTWTALGAAVLCVITLAAMVFVPESPRWLMAKGRKDEALWTIKFLHGHFLDPADEIATIQEDLDSKPKGSIEFAEFLSPEIYKPALLAIGLLISQPCCGINVVLFYTVAILQNASHTLKATTSTIIVMAIQVVVTLLSSFLMDKAGRRVLLLVSGSVMGISLIGFGAFDFAVQNDATATVQTTYGWLPVLCIVVFVSAFSLGLGPIPWLMLNEMTTVRFRSVVSGVAAVLNFTVVFILTKTVHDMETAIHTYGTYWFYAGMCCLSCLFFYFFLPETKGKKIEEIQNYFISNTDDSTAMKSVEIIKRF